MTALFCALLTTGVAAIFIIHGAGSEDSAVCRLELSRKALLRVKDDYLRGRFPHWYREKSTLGTLTPELVFGEVTIEEDEYRVPFVAKGPATTLARIGFVDCVSMDVEYIAGK
ncbi:YebF family protein [Kluyvera genomosp. 1]|uniref:YebF family protein n=1 Tax=Kluyvera genomosp. 1 TaxID=2774053 RepID=UPI0018D09444|nr:YebF family protein [Kluyvera genomosp. 1]